MRYFLFLLLSFPAFAEYDEVTKLSEEAKARREAWKVFREKVSTGTMCEPGDYRCFVTAASKIPGVHPEDIIASRSILEPFYLRSISGDVIPCGDTCKNNNRASHVFLFLQIFNSYISGQEKVYNSKEATTVRAARFRAIMDLSALGNMNKHMEYVKAEYGKIDFSKVTVKKLTNKSLFEGALANIESGQLFSQSILCHLHPGNMVYDEISLAPRSKVNDKYREWLKHFDETVRKSCKDSTPIDHRGMDASTRSYYSHLMDKKIKEIDCPAGDFACVRKHLRTFEIRYASDISKVSRFLADFENKGRKADCDASCKANNLLRGTQTFITYLSLYDRQKLGSTMDWTKDPEARYRTIPEDVKIYEILNQTFNNVITELAKIDSAKISDPGLKSELKSIAKDSSDFASGKMLKDSVICTMDPWTAAYDKYMVPYKDPKQNKIFEANFLEFKEKVCK